MSEPRAKKSSGCLSFIMTALFLFLCFVVIANSSSNDTEPTEKPKLMSGATAAPTSTAPAEDPLAWAKHYASQHASRDIAIKDVRLINSQTNGRDMCFILDVRCNHTDTALQFACLNEVMINLCQAMSTNDHIDCVSFTVYDQFMDQYGNTKDIVSVTASYKLPTLRIVNYDYHMSFRYSTPTAFISCADAHFIHPGYSFK